MLLMRAIKNIRGQRQHLLIKNVGPDSEQFSRALENLIWKIGTFMPPIE